MPEDTSPKPLKSLPVAEFRVSIQDRRSAYPIALSGLNVRSLHFYEDPATGMHRRRYVAGWGDPDKGVFPLEQARTDMAELQHTGNSAHLLVWEYFTVEEYEAAEKQKRAAIAADEAREEARVAALAEAVAEQAKAAEKIEEMKKPGAVVPPLEDGGNDGGKKASKLKATLDRIGGK